MKKTDLCNPANSRITVGDIKTTYTAGSKAEAKKDLEETKKDLVSSIDQARADLKEDLDNAAGLFQTTITQEDGSTIYYLHDKKTLEQSTLVLKLNAKALGVSLDGGNTYSWGFDFDGNAILNEIYAIGLNADKIKTGCIIANDADGNEIFYLNVATGEVRIGAKCVNLHSETLEKYLDDTESKITEEIRKAYVDSTVTADQLIIKAVKEYVKTSDLDQFKQEVSTQFTQNSDSFQMIFSKVESELKDLEDSTNEEFKEIKKWIRFTDGKIILGESGNTLELTLQNDRISFTSAGVEVAYFSNNQMYVDSIVVRNNASIVGLEIRKFGRHIQLS